MAKTKKQKRDFIDLTWNDLEEWAGEKIVSRGKDYQRQGHVSQLARTKDNSLIAWVDGTREYTTMALMRGDLPLSICTCPYQHNCKHGVAIVIEYLEQRKKNQAIPEIGQNDERLRLLVEGPEDDEEYKEPVLRKNPKDNVDSFLKGMTKEKLISLVHELRENIPEITGALIDRQQLQSSDKKPMISRLRKEIREIADEPGWQDYWKHDGYTPDYSGIRNKLNALLKAGYADDVLSLGKELMSNGTRHVETSNDEGETAMEIAECIPIIVKALEASSISQEEKLAFAVDSLIEDSYELFESFFGYLNHKHAASVWNSLADRLIDRLNGFPSGGDPDPSRNYKRDQISDWAIHSLEKTGRHNEIIPLCESEAEKTGSYVRLVERLVEDKRFEDAERWIQKGIKKIGDKWPGISSNLRGELLKIRAHKRDWHSVAAMAVYEFVQYQSDEVFSSCKKTSEKVNLWPKVRELLLKYLETGTVPWKQKDWPLPEPPVPYSKTSHVWGFPMIGNLIDIAILEKKPEDVLLWFDKIPKTNSRWIGVNLDKVATAVQAYAPDRAVSLWKREAENYIAQVNPKAYKDAAIYLRKAEKVMAPQGKQKEWDDYIVQLKKEHIRKIRLIEVLDKLHGQPIMSIKK